MKLETGGVMGEFPDLVMEGKISIPYRWTTGKMAGRFFTELRDNKKIYGVKCGGCGKVYVPPPDLCGACYAAMGEWVEIADTGTITTFTVVHHPLIWRPLEPPYAIAAIRLDGADTDFLHLLKTDDYARLRCGLRVNAVWKEQRSGTLLDIDHFTLASAWTVSISKPANSKQIR
jgi:uncharacterized OB-fold protein